MKVEQATLTNEENELNDMETMQLIPSCINHPVFKHLGGVGEYRLESEDYYDDSK